MQLQKEAKSNPKQPSRKKVCSPQVLQPILPPNAISKCVILGKAKLTTFLRTLDKLCNWAKEWILYFNNVNT